MTITCKKAVLKLVIELYYKEVIANEVNEEIEGN